MALSLKFQPENNGLEFEERVRDKCKKYCLGSISDVVREIWWSINNSNARAHIAPTRSRASPILLAAQFPHGKSLKEAIFSAFAQTSSEKEDD